VVYNSSSDIGGFQFNVDGAIINDASGGDAANAGFMISYNDNMALGLSFTGETFGPCGTMIHLDLSGEAAGLSGFIISDGIGQPIDFTYYVESDSDFVFDCSDEYPNCFENYYDCLDECGGTAVEDDCGVCGGDGSDDVGCGCFEPGPSGCDNTCGSTLENDECGVCGGDGSSCIGVTPELFEFGQSTLQAFYFFNSALDLNGNLIESTDWVAAFKGNVCVGARQWNISQCGGGVCDIPVMGDDGEEWTSGYMVNGDIPTLRNIPLSCPNTNIPFKSGHPIC
jgi:hypothetical protein